MLRRVGGVHEDRNGSGDPDGWQEHHDLPGGITSRLSAGLGGIGVASSLVTRIYYGTYLFAAPSTYRRIADVLMPSGAFFRFVQNEDGTFTAVAPRKDGLVKNGDGTWDLTIAGSRTQYHFLANGNVSYIQDEFGNRLEYTYDGNGRLTRIADGRDQDGTSTCTRGAATSAGCRTRRGGR